MRGWWLLWLLCACHKNEGTRAALPPTVPLRVAALTGELGEVNRLLAKTHDQQLISEALISAAGGGHIAIADKLLAAGADINGRDHDGGITPIILASFAQQEAMVAHLIAKGADPNVQNDDHEGALHTAAKGPSGEIVRRLLAAGARIEMRDKHGRTPIIQHAQEG